MPRSHICILFLISLFIRNSNDNKLNMNMTSWKQEVGIYHSSCDCDAFVYSSESVLVGRQCRQTYFVTSVRSLAWNYYHSDVIKEIAISFKRYQKEVCLGVVFRSNSFWICYLCRTDSDSIICDWLDWKKIVHHSNIFFQVKGV